jgi:hypothetical protein
MKKTMLFIFAACLVSASCKKKSSCTCKDPSGKITYNEVLETRSKLEKKHFEDNCLERGKTYYTVQTGTAAPTTTQVPCELS